MIDRCAAYDRHVQSSNPFIGCHPPPVQISVSACGVGGGTVDSDAANAKFDPTCFIRHSFYPAYTIIFTTCERKDGREKCRDNISSQMRA